LLTHAEYRRIVQQQEGFGMLAAARKDLLVERLRRDGRIVAKEIAG